MNTVTRIKTKTPMPYELTAIHRDTHDTKTFCFALPDEATLDMLPGDHLYVHATIDGKTGQATLHAVIGTRHNRLFRLDDQAVRIRSGFEVCSRQRGRRYCPDERTEYWRPLGGWHGEEGGVCGGWYGHHPDDFHHSLDSRQES